MSAPRRSRSPVPVVVSFAESASRQDCWGRLSELTPATAVLSTRFSVARGERLFLTMKVAGSEFRQVPALAARVATDRDGYTLAELKITDEVQKRRLARVLLDLLAT